MAADVFWTSYSAYARAVPSNACYQLLDILSEENKASWNQIEDFKLGWCEKYDKMVSFYTAKLKAYADKFLRSPAGLQFGQDVEECRKKHSRLPTMDKTTLKKYKDVDGIPWSMAEVADFFHILSVYTRTEPFESSVYL